jgi:hypothetical protein
MAVVALALVLPLLIIESPLAARVVAISGVCLALWLLELVPPFVPTLLLWVLVPVFLSPVDSKYSLMNTLRVGGRSCTGSRSLADLRSASRRSATVLIEKSRVSLFAEREAHTPCCCLSPSG